MESMMTANFEKHAPEVSGLLAANSGFAVVEAAFIPVSLRITPAALWCIAVISLGLLATAGGMTAAGDLPAMGAVEALSATAEAIPAAATQSTPKRTEAAKNSSVLPVVLRGQPPSIVGPRS
jgi:hypothetical protein